MWFFQNCTLKTCCTQQIEVLNFLGCSSMTLQNKFLTVSSSLQAFLCFLHSQEVLGSDSLRRHEQSLLYIVVAGPVGAVTVQQGAGERVLWLRGKIWLGEQNLVMHQHCHLNPLNYNFCFAMIGSGDASFLVHDLTHKVQLPCVSNTAGNTQLAPAVSLKNKSASIVCTDCDTQQVCSPLDKPFSRYV